MDQLAGEHIEDIVQDIKRLVYSILKKHGIKGNYVREECLQAGMVGAVKAMHNFDESQGVKFISYARLYIKGEVYRTLSNIRKEDLLKTPDIYDKRRIDLDFSLRNAAKNIVAERYNCSVEELDILEHLGQLNKYTHIMKDEVEEEIEKLSGLKMYIKELQRADKEYVESYVERDLLNKEKYRTINQCIKELPERLKNIIHRLYFKEELAKQIAFDFGVSKSRITQLRNAALKKLKDCLNRRLT